MCSADQGELVALNLARGVRIRGSCLSAAPSSNREEALGALESARSFKIALGASCKVSSGSVEAIPLSSAGSPEESYGGR